MTLKSHLIYPIPHTKYLKPNLNQPNTAKCLILYFIEFKAQHLIVALNTIIFSANYTLETIQGINLLTLDMAANEFRLLDQ